MRLSASFNSTTTGHMALRADVLIESTGPDYLHLVPLALWSPGSRPSQWGPPVLRFRWRSLAHRKSNGLARFCFGMDCPTQFPTAPPDSGERSVILDCSTQFSTARLNSGLRSVILLCFTVIIAVGSQF